MLVCTAFSPILLMKMGEGARLLERPSPDRNVQEFAGCLTGGSWPATRRDPALGTTNAGCTAVTGVVACLVL